MTTTYWAQKEVAVHNMVNGVTIDGSIEILEGLLNLTEISLRGDLLDNERLHYIELRLIVEDYLHFYKTRQDKIRRSVEMGGEA